MAEETPTQPATPTPKPAAPTPPQAATSSTQQVSAPSKPTPTPPSNPGSMHSVFTLPHIIAVITLVVVLSLISYYCGVLKCTENGFGIFNSAQKELTEETQEGVTPTTVASPTVLQPTPTSTPTLEPYINDSRIWYGFANGEIYFRYKDVIYSGIQNYTPQVSQLNPNDTDWWKPLVEAPEFIKNASNVYSDELFSYIRYQSNNVFYFIMRYSDGPTTEYTLFKHEEIGDITTRIITFPTNQLNSDYQVPKIVSMSPDGQIMELNMFGCWNCGGHQPQTVLLRLSDNKMVNLNRVKEFTWTGNTEYSYKEFIEKECPEPGPGVCSEDASSLPLKTGAFQ